MARPKFVLYAIPREQVEGLDVESLLDMLRYDGATVESNPPDGHYLFRIEGGFKQPAVRRWASFGVKGVVIMDPDYPRDVKHGFLHWEAI